MVGGLTEHFGQSQGQLFKESRVRGFIRSHSRNFPPRIAINKITVAKEILQVGWLTYKLTAHEPSGQQMQLLNISP